MKKYIITIKYFEKLFCIADKKKVKDENFPHFFLFFLFVSFNFVSCFAWRRIFEREMVKIICTTRAPPPSLISAISIKLWTYFTPNIKLWRRS